MDSNRIWNYHQDVGASELDVVGFDVEALDGEIGSVDSASRETDDAHLVVDTGGWIFGKKRLIPAGVVAAVDVDNRRVRVNMTKDQVKSAPDWNAQLTDDEWRDRHDRYYSPFGFQSAGNI
jgi:hypothetical protein